MNKIVERTAGRLLIIDADARVLMINEEIEAGHPYWLIPGGGVEDRESPRHAAVRETYEETGLRIDLQHDSPQVRTERRKWSYGGITYDQTNHFFAVRVESGLEPSPAQLTELERNTFLGFRWWHPDEVEASDEVFFPAEIADLVRAVVASA
jgi:8-oxo-dGTP pyrophosphatase MutT (NUDIX family)